MLQAPHEAVLRAEIPPTPSGSLPTPLSTIPTSACVVSPYCCLGVVVILENQDTPLHPPSGRGDKRLRQADRKLHVEYWHELLAYVDAAYSIKFRRHYPWNNLTRKNLWNLARGYSAWEVMALWQLYMECQSWWAKKTYWSVYGMVRDSSRLMDDPQFRRIALKFEGRLAEEKYGVVIQHSRVFNSLFPCNTNELTVGHTTQVQKMPRKFFTNAD